jgi:hypothetical protein
MFRNQPKSILVALCVVGALLAADFGARFFGPGFPDTVVLAQRQAPIAGGAGVFVMPAQLSGNVWGCYLVDVDRSTLCCYQYLPGSRELQFVAARNFRGDTQLANFNTTPSPNEILDLVNKQNQGGPARPTAPQP